MGPDRMIMRLGAFLWAVVFVAVWYGRDWAMLLLWVVFS